MIIPHLSLIKTTNIKKLFTISKVRQFTINSDEPLNSNGTDLAPSPFDLLNASLASCTAIFIRLFAQKNNINIGEISIKIKIKKNENNGFLFERSISFENQISNGDKDLILVAVRDTPVTKIIRLSQPIETKIM
jgi:putative redox protein